MKLFCNVTRNDNIESKHEVFTTVIDEDKKIIFSTGTPDYMTCIRSALKPFQASAVISSGAIEKAGFIDTEIALMCASHNGEKTHVQIAKKMIEKLGLNMSYYECGIHAPYDINTRNKAREKGFTVYHNNCSGKHCGMLAIANKLDVDPKNYTCRKHPVQKEIFSQLKKLTKKNSIPIGIDGCSAPTPFLSLLEIAKLFQLLGSNKYSELTKVYNVMAEHPYLIAGKNRFDTDFNFAFKGRGITKIGGEGIRGAVIKTKNFGIIGIAQKVVDGNQRANETAIMKTLDYLGLLLKEEKIQLNKYKTKKIFNHRNIHIGNIEAVIQE